PGAVGDRDRCADGHRQELGQVRAAPGPGRAGTHAEGGVMNRAERSGVVRVLRSAVDGTAAEVRPEELAPLHLVPRTGGLGQATAVHLVRTRRFASRPVAAIGAAVAVLAVAAASFGAASVLRTDRNAEMTGPKLRAGPLSLIPRYFVELERPPAGA